MTDLTKITTPYGLLDPETRKALRNCGGPWEFWADCGSWLPTTADPRDWISNTTYRKAPQPVTYPKIPWKLLPVEFDRAAIDADGACYAYGRKVIGNSWVRVSRQINDLPGFNPGTCDWRDSLVERPK